MFWPDQSDCALGCILLRSKLPLPTGQDLEPNGYLFLGYSTSE